MNTYLYRHEADEDLFPELALGAGQRGLRCALIRVGSDTRLQLPRSAKSWLLVVRFRLGAATDPASVWQLTLEHTDKQGKPVQQRLALLPEPVDGNARERVIGPPGYTPPPGLIYRGTFWVALDPLWVEPVPGRTASVSYGTTTSSLLTLP